MTSSKPELDIMDRSKASLYNRTALTILALIAIFSVHQVVNYWPASKTRTSIKLEHCPCKRQIKSAHLTNSQYIAYENTTCSRDAYARGQGQKVVGFSFYANVNSKKSKVRGYFQGIRANLELMKRFYPGWQMRVYFDLDEGNPLKNDLCKMACKYSILDLCHAGKLPGSPIKDARKVFAMIWRFFPTLDPQV